MPLYQIAFALFLCIGTWLWGAGRPAVPARNGMVVSGQGLASQVGVDILKQGGNAVDAAVAVGFALTVVHPAAGNIGGGGFMVIHEASSGRDYSLDYRETAPASAHRDMYLDAAGNVREGLSTRGHLASGVPGSVAGMHLAWSKFGKLPWARLIGPATRLAREGFAVSSALERSLLKYRERLYLCRESRRVFLRDGEPYREGDILRQPDLANTLERIAQDGPGAFYQGVIADRIVDDMKAHGGRLTRQDLANYRSLWREPVRGSYRGYEIVSMGPPSSGGVVLLEMTNLIEAFPVAQLGFNSSLFLHLKAEVMRLAFADRAAFLGDADFSSVPVDELISKRYATQRRKRIDKQWAAPSTVESRGEPSWSESRETAHYSVVDKEGSAVAVTTTINGSYGSGVTIRGAGFLMNSTMDDFTVKPGVPNMFDLIQGEANTIASGKRPLSAMTPTLVKKDSAVFLVLGSRGGPAIINTVFQALLNVIDFDLDIQRAIDAPRIHHQWLPDRIEAEPDAVVRDTEIALQEKGHRLIIRGEQIGEANSILVEPDSGIRWGAADPRGAESQAVGY